MTRRSISGEISQSFTALITLFPTGLYSVLLPLLIVFLVFLPVMLCVVWDYSNIKRGDKQYKQKNSPKSYKTQVKIRANPGLA